MRRLVWKSVDGLARILHGKPKDPPTDRDRALAEELRRAAAALPAVDETADAWWRDCAREFRERMVSVDDPRDFTRWPIIQRTMFLGNRKQAFAAWRHLR